MNAFLDLQNEEADYNRIIPTISEICPSFQVLKCERTPHAGILYINFRSNLEDLKTISKYAQKASAHIAVHTEEEKLFYRMMFSVTRDELFIKYIKGFEND